MCAARRVSRDGDRRPAGEGSVYFDEVNGCWFACLPRGPDGKRPKRRAKSEAEAWKKLRALQRQREQGLATEKQPALLSYAPAWLAAKKSIAPNTRAAYQYLIDRWLIPLLGKLRIDGISPDHVRALISAIEKAERSPWHAYVVLRAMLNTAVREGKLVRNPVKLVEAPAPPAAVVQPLEPAGVVSFFDVITEHRLELLYHIAIFHGPREGECLGLLWSDLDWETGALKITGQVQTVKIDGTYVTRRVTWTKASKRKKSTDSTKHRVLYLTPAQLDRLREHWKCQQDERRMRGVEWREHGLMFPSEVGTPIQPRNLVTHFKKALKRASLPETTRFHDLRHTCATLMLTEGAKLLDVADQLGHSAISTTANFYGHVYEETRRSHTGALEERVKRERIKKGQTG